MSFASHIVLAIIVSVLLLTDVYNCKMRNEKPSSSALRKINSFNGNHASIDQIIPPLVSLYQNEPNLVSDAPPIGPRIHYEDKEDKYPYAVIPYLQYSSLDIQSAFFEQIKSSLIIDAVQELNLFYNDRLFDEAPAELLERCPANEARKNWNTVIMQVTQIEELPLDSIRCMQEHVRYFVDQRGCPQLRQLLQSCEMTKIPEPCPLPKLRFFDYCSDYHLHYCPLQHTECQNDYAHDTYTCECKKGYHKESYASPGNHFIITKEKCVEIKKCGKEDEPCCADSKCAWHLKCNDDEKVCKHCGNEDEPCCNGEWCSNPLQCGCDFKVCTKKPEMNCMTKNLEKYHKYLTGPSLVYEEWEKKNLPDDYFDHCKYYYDVHVCDVPEEEYSAMRAIIIQNQIDCCPDGLHNCCPHYTGRWYY